MARTTIVPQRLATRAGQQITFQPFDTVNGHQYRNTGVEVVLVRLDSGSSVALDVISVADTFGRTGDVVPTVTGVGVLAGGFMPSTLFALGPFTPTQIWGDGSSQNQINESAVVGSGGIAVITI